MWVSVVAFTLVIAIGGYFIGSQYIGSTENIVRTVQLENSQLDTQAILDTFENYDLKEDGDDVHFIL